MPNYTEEELKIIRAVNYCSMTFDQLKQIAIAATQSMGEAYVEHIFRKKVGDK
jgi:hypothetical protein